MPLIEIQKTDFSKKSKHKSQKPCKVKENQISMSYQKEIPKLLIEEEINKNRNYSKKKEVSAKSSKKWATPRKKRGLFHRKEGRISLAASKKLKSLETSLPKDTKNT